MGVDASCTEGASDVQIEELLEYSKTLLSAAQNGDSEGIGRQLDLRGKCMNAIKAAGGFGSRRTAERQALVDEIIQVDGKACRGIRELLEKDRQAMLDYGKKTAGVKKYNYMEYNFGSGRLIDKKD